MVFAGRGGYEEEDRFELEIEVELFMIGRDSVLWNLPLSIMKEL
jgi:hypothetical protein